jgi:hypothetical protein
MLGRRSVRRAAWIAAGLAFASAGVSAYWTLGGAVLLDTVGGAIQSLARKRSPEALALGATTVALKVAAGILAIGLARFDAGGSRRRLLLLANGMASAVLFVWGGANVVVGALVLSGAIRRRMPTAAPFAGTSSFGTCGSSSGASRLRWSWWRLGVVALIANRHADRQDERLHRGRRALRDTRRSPSSGYQGKPPVWRSVGRLMELPDALLVPSA